MKLKEMELTYNGEKDYRITITQEFDKSVTTTIREIQEGGREVAVDRVSSEEDEKSISELLEAAKSKIQIHPVIAGLTNTAHLDVDIFSNDKDNKQQ